MKTYGLTGQSLLHSFSKDFFNKKFLSENISARYLNFEIENIKYLRELFIKNPISGLNVTIPYKEKIIPYLDSLDNISKSVVEQLLKRNKDLPPTKVVEITNLVGCSAIKK